MVRPTHPVVRKRLRGEPYIARAYPATVDEVRTLVNDVIRGNYEGSPCAEIVTLRVISAEPVVDSIVNVVAQVLVNNGCASDVHDMTIMTLLAREEVSGGSNHLIVCLVLMALIYEDITTTSTIPNYAACVVELCKLFCKLQKKPEFCSWVQAFAILNNRWDIARLLQQNMPPLTAEDYQTDFLFTPVTGEVYTSIFKLFLQYRENADLHFGFFSYLSTAFAVLVQSDDWNRSSAQFSTQVVDAAADEAGVERMLDDLYDEVMCTGSPCEKLFMMPARALCLADHTVRAIAIAAAGSDTTETSLTNSNLKRFEDACEVHGWSCMFNTWYVHDVDQVFSFCDESLDQLAPDALQVLLALEMNVHVPEEFLQAMTTTAMQDVQLFGARVPTLDEDGRETLRSVSRYLVPYTGPRSLSQMLPEKAKETRSLLKTLLLVQKRCTLNRDVMHHLAGFF